MSKKLDIKQGDKYGRLTIIREVEHHKGQRFFLCECQCGNTKEISLNRLYGGKTKSCGCYRKETTRDNWTRHGQRHTRLYTSWCGMKSRCNKPSYHGYKYYNGNGITICEGWQSFPHFYEWAMNNGYQDDLTLERIDNTKGYSPDNCKWIPKNEQPLNSSHNRMITINGETSYLSDWVRRFGISRTNVYRRLSKGWNLKDALTLPVKVYNR